LNKFNLNVRITTNSSLDDFGVISNYYIVGNGDWFAVILFCVELKFFVYKS